MIKYWLFLLFLTSCVPLKHKKTKTGYVPHYKSIRVVYATHDEINREYERISPYSAHETGPIKAFYSPHDSTIYCDPADPCGCGHELVEHAFNARHLSHDRKSVIKRGIKARYPTMYKMLYKKNNL